MPESRTYVVTRTQQVRVNANSHADAQRLAVAALDGRDRPDDIAYGGPVYGHNLDPEATTVDLRCERTS